MDQGILGAELISFTLKESSRRIAAVRSPRSCKSASTAG
jgi:hypothetical protein